jgi:LysM repeat protein
MPSDSPTLDPAAKPAAAPRGGSEPPMAAPEQFAAAPLPHAAAVRAQPAAAPKPADQPETPGSPVQVARAGTVADPDSVAPPKARQPPAKEGEAAAGDVLAHPPEEATAAVPTAPQDAPHIDGVRFSEVVVRSGDSMSGIAMRKYGQASYTILDLLKLANPQVEDIDIIPVGQTIRLPDLGEGFPILNDGSSHYALLVFSTPHASRASAFQKVLRARTFDARVTVGSVGVEKPMYRVVVSGFTNRDDVVAAGKELQRLFREDTRLAQLGE